MAAQTIWFRLASTAPFRRAQGWRWPLVPEQGRWRPEGLVHFEQLGLSKLFPAMNEDLEERDFLVL